MSERIDYDKLIDLVPCFDLVDPVARQLESALRQAKAAQELAEALEEVIYELKNAYDAQPDVRPMHVAAVIKRAEAALELSGISGLLTGIAAFAEAGKP